MIKKGYLTFVFALFLLLASKGFSQNVGINADGADPNASAMLDITAPDKGLLIPRITLTGTSDATTISASETSLLIYNTASVSDVTPGFYYWNGSVWIRLSTGDANQWTTSGSDIYFNGGNVGIGTPSPDANSNLHIKASSDLYNSFIFLENGNSSTNGYAGIRLNAHTTGTGNDASIAYYNENYAPYLQNALGFLNYHHGGNIWFRTEDDTGTSHESIITGAGDVGIGTISPSVKLDVNGEACIGTGTPVNQKGILTIASPDAATAANIRFTHGTSGYIGMGSNQNQDFEINHDWSLGPNTGTLFMVERNTGNVGIGTTSPNNLLHVNKAISANYIASFDNDAADGNGVHIKTSSSSSADAALSIQSGVGSLFRVSASGNIGIGTTSPEANSLLHIKASSDLYNSFIFLENGNSSTNGYAGIRLNAHTTGTGNDASIAYYNENYASYLQNALGLLNYHHGGNIYFRTEDDTGTSHESLISGAGNLGIGTTNPSVKLEVNGGIKLGDPDTNDDGLLDSDGTTTVPSGTLRYDSSADKAQVRTTTAWIDLH